MKCPCGTKQDYDQCCGPYINGDALPPSPEALMRSRYTAYTKADTAYIEQTQRGPAAKGFDPRSSKSWAEQVEWLGLEVCNAMQNGDLGFVTFKAHFKQDQTPRTLFEKSEFHRIDGKWFYMNTAKTERNDPCPCGSGKKYKKCCLE